MRINISHRIEPKALTPALLVTTAVALTCFLGNTAKATLLLPIPPNSGQADLTPSASPGGDFVYNGTTVANLTSSFDVTSPNTHIVGTIETIVVRRNSATPTLNIDTASPVGFPQSNVPVVTPYAALGLDFYYQIKLNPVLSSVNADLRALTLSAFDPSSLTGSGAISAFSLTDVGNIPGLFRLDSTPAVNGLQSALLASRDTAGVKLDFRKDSSAQDNSLFNVPGKTDSNWIVLRTNSTNFTTGTGALIDGVAFFRDILAPAPVPEPSSILFGLAIFGGFALRHRNRLKGAV